MESVKIKKISDLENCLGKQLSVQILKTVKHGLLKKKPNNVYFLKSKPVFCLNDGSTLTCYAVNLKEQKIIGKHYCGSSDSVYQHKSEQLGEGHNAPDDSAYFFVETYWNGQNMSWDLTVVSDSITKQLG